MHRFIVSTVQGSFVAAVYADRLEEHATGNSFTGSRCCHLFRGGEVVASVDLGDYCVGDSGGIARSVDSAIIGGAVPY